MPDMATGLRVGFGLSFGILVAAELIAAERGMGHLIMEARQLGHLGVSIFGILLIVAASLMYYAEHEAQPKVFSSIPGAMWWAAVTLTTVGYGDAYPVTPIGKVMASMTAMLGIGMFALPTAILGAGFLDDLAGRKKTQRCPHCGKEL